MVLLHFHILVLIHCEDVFFFQSRFRAVGGDKHTLTICADVHNTVTGLFVGLRFQAFGFAIWYLFPLLFFRFGDECHTYFFKESRHFGNKDQKAGYAGAGVFPQSTYQTGARVDVLVEWILIAAADHADDWLDIIEELRNIIIRAEKFIATYRYIDFALNRPFDRYAPSG